MEAREKRILDELLGRASLDQILPRHHPSFLLILLNTLYLPRVLACHLSESQTHTVQNKLFPRLLLSQDLQPNTVSKSA